MVIGEGTRRLPRLGQNAADVLKAANINVYKTIGGSAKDNVEAFVAGKLNLLDDIHAGYHNHNPGGR